MIADLQNVILSRLGTGLALGLGNLVPPGIAHRLIRRLAGVLASQRKLGIVQAARLNQWMACEGSLSASQLDQAVQEAFLNRSRFLYDLYHYINDLSQVTRLVNLGDKMEGYLEITRQGKQSLVFAVTHLGNYDFIGRAIAQRGLRAFGLTYPQPTRSYQWDNILRLNAGLEVKPLSTSSLRQAVKRLQAGGSVMIGIDRPLPEAKLRPRFFGRPSSLPVLHVRMALRAGAPVVVIGSVMRGDGAYQVLASEPIWMQSHEDPQAELLINAERVLKVAADFIRLAPRQWAMFYPVWPEALTEVP